MTVTTHRQCGKSWTGQSKSHCPVCHRTFSGDWAGDRHRVGEWDDGTRRCLTDEEMTKLGLESRAGTWFRMRTPAELARIDARYGISDTGSQE